MGLTVNKTILLFGKGEKMNQLIVSLLQDKIDEYSDYAKEEYERHSYYCWDDKIRQNLIALLKIRSEYKRVLKEYKRQCEQI